MKSVATAVLLGLLLAAFPCRAIVRDRLTRTPSPDGRFIVRTGYAADGALEILSAATHDPVFSTDESPPPAHEGDSEDGGEVVLPSPHRPLYSDAPVLRMIFQPKGAVKLKSFHFVEP